MNLIKYNVNDVYCIGDIHGHFDAISYFIKNNSIKNAVLIFCGDIGFGFERPMYYKQVFDRLSKTCQKNNVYVIFFRGNHDDPSYFDGKKVNRKWIKAVPDYTVIQTFLPEDENKDIPTKTLLLIGGGTSIDRQYRIKKQNERVSLYARYHGISNDEARTLIGTDYYWANELPVFNPEAIDEVKDNNIKIEYVCTHSSPKFCTPIDKDNIKGWMEYDETLEKDINIERDVMTLVYDKVRADGHPLKAWYNGHFHKKGYEEFDDVKFYHLDMERDRLDVITVY